MGLVYGYPMPESKRDSPVGRGKPPVHAVDVGRAIAHHPIAVAAQVSDADIVAQMTRMFGLFALDLDLAISISCRWSAALGNTSSFAAGQAQKARTGAFPHCRIGASSERLTKPDSLRNLGPIHAGRGLPMMLDAPELHKPAAFNWSPKNGAQCAPLES